MPRSARAAMRAAIAAAGLALVCAWVPANGQSLQKGTTAEGSAEAEAVADLPPGTAICAELSKTVDAKKAKPGDTVEARTTLAVISQGKVAIPDGTKLLGHVTSAKRRNGKHGRSELGIVFDRVLLKHKTSVPLATTVQAIGIRPVTPESITADTGHASDGSRLPLSAGQRGVAPPPLTTPVSPGVGPDELGVRPPLLDAGSHGVSGYKDLHLKESEDPRRASIVSSTKKNVKLDDGTEIILRVLTPMPKDLFLP